MASSSFRAAEAGSSGAGNNFPVAGILPKAETQADAFVKKHPDGDGRGVVVAIFDTGVDLGAEGLQVTTTGDVKIIDAVDATGSGDVDMSAVAAVEAGGEGEDDGVRWVQGLSGRRLLLGDWTNPTGVWRVGIKRAYELFPKPLVTRIKAERKKEFLEAHRTALADAQLALDAFVRDHPGTVAGADARAKADLEATLEALRAVESSYDDAGPVYDIVLFHDGDNWRAAVDSSESGDLRSLSPLAPYAVAFEYATFSSVDLLNFSINVYDEGNVLSIVVCAGAHGTHVAGIVAANYPDSPELNGVAPGAQIVSVKIGDSRLGSMETGTGLVRGLIAALRTSDVINMSYGEATNLPDVGRFVELATECVNRHRMIFVSSAGNNGPALSTVGCPGGTNAALIGVGAYVSPPMMQVEYSLRERLPAIQYTWSSRGPAPNGTMGVDISAPGGAIAPIPTYTLAKSRLMNGTSMSSPNACGGIALLLSAAKAAGIPYTPHTVRRAVQNTAVPVDGVEVHAQGNGVIQVSDAFAYMERVAEGAVDGVRYEAVVKSRGGGSGVYLREAAEAEVAHDLTVAVSAVFPDETDNRAKVAFEKRVTVVSTVPWVEAPSAMVLQNLTRPLGIRIDPRGLDRGAVHFGEVLGLDAADPGAGPLFRVPITVIRPVAVDGPVYDSGALDFTPGHIDRAFLTVPEGADFAKIVISPRGIDTQRQFVLHTVQLRPDLAYEKGEFQKWLSLADTDVELTFPVVAGLTLEVTLAQFWSALGDASASYRLEFFGLDAQPASFHLDGGDGVARIDLRASLRRTKVEPKATLTTIHRPLRPASSSISVVNHGLRDTLPDARRIHELILSYSLKLDADATVTLRAPALSQVLYESPYEAQFWQVFDGNKQLVHQGDYRPASKALSKGSYTVRYKVRHDDYGLLDKITGLVLRVELKASKEASLSLHATFNNALTAGAAWKAKTLKEGERCVLYAGAPSTLPSEAVPGDTLVGTIKFLANDGARSYPISFTVPPALAKASTSGGSGGGGGGGAADGTEAAAETVLERMEKHLLGQKVEFLKTLSGRDYDALAESLLAENGAHLPLLAHHLSSLDKSDMDDAPGRVLDLGQRIVDLCDPDAISAYFGVRRGDGDAADLSPDEAAAAAALKSDMEEKKAFLVAALEAMARAAAKRDGYDSDAFGDAWRQLRAWADLDGVKYTKMAVEREQALGHPGLAMKRLVAGLKAAAGESFERELYDMQLAMVEANPGWSHWAMYLRAWMSTRFPAAYPII